MMITGVVKITFDCRSGATAQSLALRGLLLTNQVRAQFDLMKIWKETKTYKSGVYLLPNELDEKVARLHLPFLDAKLTRLSKAQAVYIGVKDETCGN